MNIGIVADNELNDDKRILREIEILRKEGHVIFALCFAFSGKDFKPVNGITVTRIRINRTLKNILFLILNTFPAYEWLWTVRISRFIKENNLDVIHAHDLYMARCSKKAISGSLRDVKLIIDLHENFSYAISTYNWTKGVIRQMLSRPGRWKAKEAYYLDCADGIVVLSNEFRDSLTSLYPFLDKKHFCTLPNVPDVEQMNSIRPDPSVVTFIKKGVVMFYFGVVAERRGIFEALGVFMKLIEKGIDLYFLIIGPVDRKDRTRFDEMTTFAKIRERIIYRPWIDLSELPAYLDASDICIAPFRKNPQHESGVANKIYDYMLGGRPVIASDCRPQKNLIEKYNCGIIYESEDQLMNAIITLAGDAALRDLMGRNGRNAVLEELNISRVSHNLTDLYKIITKQQANSHLPGSL